MIELKKNSRVLVAGLGRRSGLAACNFLSEKGHKVVAADIKPYDELKPVIAGLNSAVKVIAGNQDPSILDDGFDILVLSPGVPASIPLIKTANSKGIPVIAEVELAYRYMKGRLAAITGTDGKSTTTSLIGHIFNELGFKTFTGGNLGTPFISFAGETDDNSISVIELSSFQLETIHDLRPDAAVILNVTPDHLDRYDNMEEYLKAKLGIAKNQTADDFYIYKKEDALLSNNLKYIKAQKLSFSLTDIKADIFYEDENIVLNNGGELLIVLDTLEMQIMGKHNIENTMASILMVSSVLKKMGIPVDYAKIEKACYSFKGLPHRMEPAGIVNGRTFINDSKATTVGAVEMALNSIPSGSILIMGGRTKGDDYSRLEPAIKNKIKHLVLIGESANDFKKIFRSVTSEIADSMDDAVAKAMEASSKGDIILLSPACASFDMFASFEERGDVFRNAVAGLNNSGK